MANRGSVDEATRLLLDKLEIHEQMVRYCHAIDGLDEDMLRRVYHADGWHVHHSNFEGSASDYAAYIIKYCREHFQGTTHMIYNELIEVEGDVATGNTYFESWCRFVRERVELDRFAAGHYIDRFERRDGVWRIARRRVVLDRTRFDPVSQTEIAGR